MGGTGSTISFLNNFESGFKIEDFYIPKMIR